MAGVRIDGRAPHLSPLPLEGGEETRGSAATGDMAYNRSRAVGVLEGYRPPPCFLPNEPKKLVMLNFITCDYKGCYKN